MCLVRADIYFIIRICDGIQQSAPPYLKLWEASFNSLSASTRDTAHLQQPLLCPHRDPIVATSDVRSSLVTHSHSHSHSHWRSRLCSHSRLRSRRCPIGTSVRSWPHASRRSSGDGSIRRSSPRHRRSPRLSRGGSVSTSCPQSRGGSSGSCRTRIIVCFRKINYLKTTVSS